MQLPEVPPLEVLGSSGVNDIRNIVWELAKKNGWIYEGEGRYINQTHMLTMKITEVEKKPRYPQLYNAYFTSDGTSCTWETFKTTLKCPE
jgi:hypothetical protein